MSLTETVRRTIQSHGLIERGARVAVALSGGGDSVALLHVLREIAEAEGFELAGAVHLNHQLRGLAADQDEEFCHRLAARCGIAIVIERVDVGAIARQAGVSLEQAAHTARHEFFERAALQLGASAVALAHTKDDQAETVLLRLLRGAGPRGLSGMHPRTGRIIRPLIATSREEVRAFLQARHIEFREDESNTDLAIPRNRIRHELIPYLEKRFSPGIIDVLDREATIAREDAEFLETQSVAVASRVIATTPHGVEIPVNEILAEPPAIARRVIRHAQQMVSAGRFVGFEAVEAVLVFLVSNSTGALDLPGHRVNRRGDRVVLTTSSGRPPRGHSVERDAGEIATRRPPAFAYQLDVPGQVEVPEAGCAISANTERVDLGESAAARWRLGSRGDQVVIEAGRLAAPLIVRNRRPGDSFRPLGLSGHKKLQDFFVDAKVQRARRDTIPLVVDSRGQIVWVAGHALAEEFRVTDRTEAVVILKRQPI